MSNVHRVTKLSLKIRLLTKGSIGRNTKKTQRRRKKHAADTQNWETHLWTQGFNFSPKHQSWTQNIEIVVTWTRHNDTRSILIILEVRACQYTEPETNHPLNKKEEQDLGGRIELKPQGGNEGVLWGAALGASGFPHLLYRTLYLQPVLQRLRVFGWGEGGG